MGVKLLQALIPSPGGESTTRLTLVEAADPEFGVAVSVPVWLPTGLAETVTVPQVAPAPQTPVGPLTVAPAMEE